MCILGTLVSIANKGSLDNEDGWETTKYMKNIRGKRSSKITKYACAWNRYTKILLFFVCLCVFEENKIRPLFYGR
jgi:hypothetical protein